MILGHLERAFIAARAAMTVIRRVLGSVRVPGRLLSGDDPEVGARIRDGDVTLDFFDIRAHGQPVRTATGDDDATMRLVEWDLADLAGRTVQLQVLDDSTTDWGHRMVDHVTLSD